MSRRPTLAIVPAYGRRYASIEAALADWRAGHDFKILGGSYLSIRDAQTLAKAGYREVILLVSYPLAGTIASLNLEEEHNAVSQD